MLHFNVCAANAPPSGQEQKDTQGKRTKSCAAGGGQQEVSGSAVSDRCYKAHVTLVLFSAPSHVT